MPARRASPSMPSAARLSHATRMGNAGSCTQMQDIRVLGFLEFIHLGIFVLLGFIFPLFRVDGYSVYLSVLGVKGF
jgi:hypothetical protein